MRVLLVDDEIEFVNTLSNRLGMRGISTDVVHDGDEALDYVAKQEPDVIVLDLKMPGLHGMEVLRRLSKTNPNIQVVILTGHGTDRDEDEAKRLQAFDYLRKPADVDHLADRIKGAYRYKVEQTCTMVAPTISIFTTLSDSCTPVDAAISQFSCWAAKPIHRKGSVNSPGELYLIAGTKRLLSRSTSMAW